MSEENQNRNNRSRNNNGRNRNRGNGGQGQGQRNRNNNNGGGNRRGGNNSASQQRDQLQPSRNRRGPKPKPLTFWQKVLKAIGLYKDPNQKPASAQKSNNGPQKNNNGGQKNGRVAGGGRVEGQGGRKPKNKQTRSGNNKENTPPTEVKTPRLYVGNLSYDATEHDLEELFKGIGSVRNVASYAQVQGLQLHYYG